MPKKGEKLDRLSRDINQLNVAQTYLKTLNYSQTGAAHGVTTEGAKYIFWKVVGDMGFSPKDKDKVWLVPNKEVLSGRIERELKRKCRLWQEREKRRG